MQTRVLCVLFKTQVTFRSAHLSWKPLLIIISHPQCIQTCFCDPYQPTVNKHISNTTDPTQHFILLSDHHQKAFSQAKTALTSAPLLYFFAITKPTRVSAQMPSAMQSHVTDPSDRTIPVSCIGDYYRGIMMVRSISCYLRI